MPKRLTASSLIEVAVAASIIVLVFSLALAVCVRLVRQGPGSRQLYYRQLVQELATTTIRTRAWHAKSVVKGNVLLESTTSPYLGNKRILHLHVTALEQDKVIAQYHELIYTDEDAH